jgi:hypothetical protein
MCFICIGCKINLLCVRVVRALLNHCTCKILSTVKRFWCWNTIFFIAPDQQKLCSEGHIIDMCSSENLETLNHHDEQKSSLKLQYKFSAPARYITALREYRNSSQMTVSLLRLANHSSDSAVLFCTVTLVAGEGLLYIIHIN